MKTKLILLALLLGLGLTLRAEKIVGGPNGGRLLAAEPHAAEFLVTADRKVEIRFFDAALQPVARGAEVVTVTAEPAAGRTVIALAQTPHGFVAQSALPAGEPYRVVVQIRATPDAKPKNFRVDLNLALCGECQRKEYACTCEGH